MNCGEADFRYGTLRFAGSGGKGLFEHAVECTEREWWHALPTSEWRVAELRREQRAELAALEVERALA